MTAAAPDRKRIGLVGCGAIARSRVRAYERHPGAELVVLDTGPRLKFLVAN